MLEVSGKRHLGDNGKRRIAVLERAASLRIHNRGNQNQIT
jgi:hypothetical protein